MARTRARALAAIASLLLGGVISVGCTSESEPGANADDAAAVYGQQFDADPSQIECLRSGFADEPSALGAFDPTTPPGQVPADDSLAAVGDVALRCLPAELVATRLSKAMAEGYGSVTPEQQQCLYDGFLALDDSQRTILLVGPVVMSANPTSPRALEYGDLTADVRDSCSVTIGSLPTDPATPGVEGDTSATSIDR